MGTSKKLNIQLKSDYKIILIIVFVSFTVGIIYNFFSPKGIQLIRKETGIVFESGTENFENAETETIDEIRALTTEQVYEIYSNREAKFVDARDNWDFADGHIPGAINIPEYKFSPDELNLKLLYKNDKIIVYCEGDQCEVSKRLAMELKKLGYKKVWIYLGGMKEWWEYKFPIEKE